MPRPRSAFLLIVIISLALTAVTACATLEPTPTPAATPSLTPEIVALITLSPTGTTLPTATHSPTPEPAIYPPPTVVQASATSRPYPISTEPPVPPSNTVNPDTYPGESTVFLPLVSDLLTPTMTPTQTPAPTVTSTPSPTPTPIPTLDFSAIEADLAGQGLDIAYAKIGFHTGVGGNSAGLDQWMRRLDQAGVPFFLKSVDNAQPILAAQELKRQSSVPHVLVFRKTAGADYDWDVPNYALPPQQAAEIHWQMHRDAFPPELDPSLVWIETINEIDKNESEWLGQFALRTAELAMADGFNWAAFGWASGEPEPDHWQTPSMLQFLQLAGNNPDRLAIALHEYSYLEDDIGDAYPYKVGRFQELFRVADQYGLPRPTVLITEWGWQYEDVPKPGQALADVAWASRLYAPYPEVKGAAIWYLGNGFGRIADQVQPLIYPVMVYSLQNYFTAPVPPAAAPIQPEEFAP